MSSAEVPKQALKQRRRLYNVSDQVGATFGVAVDVYAWLKIRPSHRSGSRRDLGTFSMK